MGPAGLTHGVLNDRLQFDTVTTLRRGRREARVRGIELGMLGEADKGEAHWEVSVFDNRFVKEDGIWKVREMRVFPLFRSDYSKGWGKSRIVEKPAGVAGARPAAARGRRRWTGPRDPRLRCPRIRSPASRSPRPPAEAVATRPLTGAIAAPAKRE